MSGSLAEMDSEFSLKARASVANIQRYVPDAYVDQYGQHFGHDFEEYGVIEPVSVREILRGYICKDAPYAAVVIWAKELGVERSCWEEWFWRSRVADKVVERLGL